MKPVKLDSIQEETLDLIISWILITGVSLSMAIEIWGLCLYRLGTGGFKISLGPAWLLSGKDFFSYSAALMSSFRLHPAPQSVMALGLVVLMLTPYARVVISAAFFALKRDWKYLAITLFVLVVLTFSLIRH